MNSCLKCGHSKYCHGVKTGRCFYVEPNLKCECVGCEL